MNIWEGKIGDNVWAAYRATLLGGAVIGTGCVAGINAVTSSQLGAHQIIAGSPVKIIRETICWSRDDTAYFNHSTLEVHITRNA